MSEKKKTSFEQEILKLIGKLVGADVQDNYVDGPDPASFDEDEEPGLRYTVSGETIWIQKLEDGEPGNWPSQPISLRQFLWKHIHLKKVCTIYQQSYREWQEENDSVGYVIPTVSDDSGVSDSPPMSAREFAKTLLKAEQGGLSLLTAEYGKGKTSFCQWFRSYVSSQDEDNSGRIVGKGFLDGSIAFPFFFNLNQYRAGDFDEFIVNRLTEYGVHLDFSVFEMLCRKGYFCVILDAWDQMHSTPMIRQTFQDIVQFSRIWGERGSVLITCRRTFYLSQLNLKRDEVTDDSAIRKARLFTLHGFRKEQAKEYLEKMQQKNAAAFPPLADWFESAWDMNQALLSRPLNLHLVVKYYDALLEAHKDITTQRVESDTLFTVLLEKWKKSYRCAISSDIVLKRLVMLTLRSGLNRGTTLEAFKTEISHHAAAFTDSDWSSLIEELRKLDFVLLTDNHRDGIEGDIEFRLAAYQEFLWAHYALDELENQIRGQYCKKTDLVGSHLLTMEARAWAVKRLLIQPSECLKTQLTYLAYKKQEDTGFTGGNALTLLGDLTRRNSQSGEENVYESQLRNVKLDSRPLCGADLHGLNLNGLVFRGSDLTDANFSYASLENTNFENTKLHRTNWSEYGSFTKCVFLGRKNPEVVVAVTREGGVLTCNLKLNTQELISLSDEVIQDISADSTGVYTTVKDGQVLYLDRQGKLNNVFVTGDALQSISAEPSNGVYVTATDEGLFRINKRNMKRTAIVVTEDEDEDSDIVKLENPDNIQYCELQGIRYVALLTQRNTCLMLLQLMPGNRAFVYGVGTLTYRDLTFEDICFAGDRLVYKVKNRGLYFVHIKNFMNSLDNNALLRQENCLLPLKKSGAMVWAENLEKLFVLEAEQETINQILLLGVNGEKEIRKIDWFWGGKSYTTGPVHSLSVSSDGTLITIAGEVLAVFLWNQDEYELIRQPLESRYRCRGGDFRFSEGLSKKDEELLRHREAIL